MMTFTDVLDAIRSSSFTEREKGARFEQLMRDWLATDPVYSGLTSVWLWEDFPAKDEFGGQDLGIDLVARTSLGEYWAIQCKFYAEDTVISKPSVDSFISNATRLFTDPVGDRKKISFDELFWISTSEKWNKAAREMVRGRDNFRVLDLETISQSTSDWEALLKGRKQDRTRKELLPHQKEALEKAHDYFADPEHDRGKLIMACGTGKTFTALSLVEQETEGHGAVLFLVPSISLLNQSVNAWMSDTRYHMQAVCICSDPKASRIREDNDTIGLVSTPLPASTNPDKISERIRQARADDSLLVVFSTYQSLEAVHDAVKADKSRPEFVFDWIVCDEAHRTTGIKFAGEKEESAFTRIHDGDFIRGKKRLYMTATPRLYGDSVKARAAENSDVLCSMDDERLYGKEFCRVGFSYAVEHGLLTDYKVLILTLDPQYVPKEVEKLASNPQDASTNIELVTKLYGCVKCLSKDLVGDGGLTWKADPGIMRRVLAFCPKIGSEEALGSSKNIAVKFPEVSRQIPDNPSEKAQKPLAKIEACHIDGSMNSSERVKLLSWLKADAGENECRVLCNVRCLSEGIDVPALDAVIFFSPRKSQIDVVQSVGRIMRNFRKGQTDEKKYGYVIIPVFIPPNMSPEEALDDDERFSAVWQVLRALRSHDERFNAIVNQIALNREPGDPPSEDTGKVRVVGAGKKDPKQPTEEERAALQKKMTAQLLLIQDAQDQVYARMVEKVGDRLYWEKWAREVGVVACNFIGRITDLTGRTGPHREKFLSFVRDLRSNINDSITEAQTIEMLAQHLVTRPVYDALFKKYDFTKNNPVSRSMEAMVQLLDEAGMAKDADVLKSFYESVRMNLGSLTKLGAKQTVIKNLYEKFFKGAFPKTVEQLGIVYTPIECVDFILHSVDALLKQEFGCRLSDEGVHVLDPFAGTGTFIARLLQSGLIRPEDMVRKYSQELHCNEIVLLAYYVADVNIESVFHDITNRSDYLRYDGICLTDTFELAEHRNAPQLCEAFRDNSTAITRQRGCQVRVIIGNPPYSVGQRSGNDNAKNLDYPVLDERIQETYAGAVETTNKNSLYDSYIRAFRWASDRLQKSQNGGIIGFITNGGWLDGNAAAGFRKCLEEEFSSIYVLNLRGDQRTMGELSRREGGKIFGAGSRAPVAITLLVYKPEHQGPAEIWYHDIGDYLKREDKLKKLRDFGSVAARSLHWEKIEPNEHGEWLIKRSGLFGTFIALGDKKNEDVSKRRESFFEPVYSNGLKTQRDAWCYNASAKKLAENIRRTICFYNAQCEQANQGAPISYDSTQFSWTDATEQSVQKGKIFAFDHGRLDESMYRPFFRQHLYFSRSLNERVYQIPRLFPTSSHENRVICVNGTGGSKDFSAFMTRDIPDLHILDSGTQCFPLWHYEDKRTPKSARLPGLETPAEYVKHEGVTDWIHRNIRARFSNTRAITKEHIFYYVYGILHSPDYRERFADDLKISLPRIPIVNDVSAFMAFAVKGKELAELHLNYEEQPPCEGVLVEGQDSGNFRVEKMRFPAKGQKDSIIYNSSIRITNIPQRAYDYVVNGRSAIEWIMECYRVKTDKESGIVNDPNDWAAEHNKPRYILDLLLSVITVSLKTLDIVDSLPRLSFEEESAENPEEAEN